MPIEQDEKRISPYESSYDEIMDYAALAGVFIADYVDNALSERAAAEPVLDSYKGLLVSLSDAESALAAKSYIVSEKAREKAAEIFSDIEERLSISDKSALPLERLCSAFGYGELEKTMIVMALLPMINADFEKTFGYINDNVNQKFPSLSLSLKLFAGGDGRQCLKLEKSLLTYILTPEIPKGGSILSAELKPKKYIAELLLSGKRAETPRYLRYERLEKVGTVCYPEEFESIRLGMEKNAPLMLALIGKKGSGRRYLTMQGAASRGNGLLIINQREYSALTDKSEAENEIITRLLLDQCFPCIENAQEGEQLDRLVKRLSSAARVIVGVFESETAPKIETVLPTVIVRIGELDRKSAFELWCAAGIEDTGFLHEIANKYRLTPAEIIRVSRFALAKTNTPVEADIDYACHVMSEGVFGDKAELIKTRQTFDDLILPDEEKRQLKEACAHIKYRHIVYDEWNFESRISYGKGLVLLFAGPPGTGKTMAAGIVAKELGLDAYRVDLSRVMSKYVGETEKSLGEIFDIAKSGNAVLFFDETDALFGKRSEIKDSNDKYANVETSYLLQKLESFDGVVLMSTNLLQNIDDAFMRRISYIVHFPLPDEAQRLVLWRSMFTPEMPLSGDIDFDYLASQFELSGALIKNTVQSAAFLAAGEDSGIGMSHIIRAVRKQLSKQGKIMLKQDFGKYSYYI